MFKKSKNKGFSLVELIVIIAILAVFAAILTPSLLQYTENSRAQKDVSAMDEVVNAVQLALADEKCFDEALKYSCTNNYLTYSDSSGNYGQQIIDGEFWAPDGSGRATTITFNPEYGSNNQIIYDLSKGIVNDMTYGNGSVAQDRIMQGAQIDNNQCYFSKLPQIYNTVRQTVGTDVITTSQTYRNSSFTIFIRFSQKDNTTVADVNGSFNGTNLYEGASASKGTGTSEYDDNDNAIVTVTNPGNTKSEYTSSDLSGTGSFGGSVSITNKIEDYKQPTYIENLQKENKCEYYSTLSLAAQDINAGTPGVNGDSTKEEAAACVYVDANGIASVIVLKSGSETQSTVFEKQVNVILGGKTITYEGTQVLEGLYLKAGGSVDGRIGGSKIINRCAVADGIASVIRAENDCAIVGGEYEVPDSKQTYALQMSKKKNFTVKDAKVTVNSNEATINHCGVCIFYNGYNSDSLLTIDNCELFVKCVNGNSYGMRCINIFGNAIITNTKGEAYADYWSDGTIGYDATAVYINESKNVTIDNCDFVSSESALSITDNSTNIKILNSKFTAPNAIDISYASIVTLKKCVINNQKQEGYTSSRNSTVSVCYSAKCVMHDCEVKGSVYLNDNSQIYTSMMKLDSSNQILLYTNSKLYLGARNNFDKTKCNNQSLVEETGLMYNNFKP